MKSDVWWLLFLCPNCSPSALTHLFSENVNNNNNNNNKLLTVDWFLWQAVPDHMQRFFVFGDWFWFWVELVTGLQHGAPHMVVNGSGATRGNWSFLTHFKFWTARNSAVADKPRDALLPMQWCVWPPALKGAAINTRQPPKLGSSETALSSGTEAWLIPFHNNNGPISYLE